MTGCVIQGGTKLSLGFAVYFFIRVIKRILKTCKLKYELSLEENLN